MHRALVLSSIVCLAAACSAESGPRPGRNGGLEGLRLAADGGAPDGYSTCVAVESCGDGVDDDCDGLVDCSDLDCLAQCERPQCVPSAEACTGGADEDCDGLVDCDDADCASAEACGGCVERTEDCGWPGCNHSDGSDEAACLAEGNTGGCPDDVFHEWCRRRTPAGRWDAIHAEWVAARCSGTIEPVGSPYVTYTCRDAASCTTYTCTTPLVLVLDGSTRVTMSSDDGRSSFDLSAAADGSATRTDWPTAATPWLALDRDGDGRIGSGRELFGSATLVGGVPARDGFEALTALDADGDGDVDARDPAFAELVAWADANGDRVSDPGELRSLASLGITALPCRYTVQPRCDARGNCERERAPIAWRDAAGRAHEGSLVDVHLRVHAEDTRP